MPDAENSNDRGSFGVLNEKIDSLADTVGKLAEVVAEDRRNSIENTRTIFSELNSVRDRATTAGRITWPLIVTTFTAALAFAAIVGGLGSYALGSTSQQLATEIGAVAQANDRQRARLDLAETQRQQNALDLATVREWQRLHEQGSRLMPQAAKFSE